MNPRFLLIALLWLMSVASASAQTLGVMRSFQVDISDQPVTVARVENGLVYILDIRNGRLVAYTEAGDKVWQREIAPEAARKSPIAMDVDTNGTAYVFEASIGEVHIVDRQGIITSRVPVRARGISGGVVSFGAVAADDRGGFYVLGNKKGLAIHHFDSAGSLTHSFAQLGADNPEAKGWVGVAPDHVVYYREGRKLTFQRYSPEGRRLGTITPSIPIQVDQQPPDSIFATEVLADGRIVCEVIHRTPYGAIGDGGGLRTSLEINTYVINPNGTVDRVISPKGLGQFGAASPDGALYFFTTARGLLRIGETPRVHKVQLR